jgi:hypothetical protein
VTKREDLRLQGRTGSKTAGYQSEKGDEKRAHRGSHHDLTIDRNLFVFRSDGIFGTLLGPFLLAERDPSIEGNAARACPSVQVGDQYLIDKT